MSWQDALTAFAEAQAEVFGEPLDYHHPDAPTALRVRALWVDGGLAEARPGGLADTAVVQVLAAELTAFGAGLVPARGQRVSRYPDDLLAAEAWTVEHVRRPSLAQWELTLVRSDSVRAVPR